MKTKTKDIRRAESKRHETQPADNKHHPATTADKKTQTAKTADKKSGNKYVVYPAKAIYWLLLCVFAVGAFVVLLSAYPLYMRKIEALSIFMTTWQYLTDCMRAPGGFVVWLSTLATLSMHTPWVGALVYALLGALLALCCKRAFILSAGLAPLAIVPSAMALMSLLQLGGVIVSLKGPGFAFSPLLGCLLAVILYRLCLLRAEWWYRAAAVAVCVAAMYPLMGFYALLAAVMVAVRALRDVKADKKQIVSAIAAIALVAVVPWLWCRYVSNDLPLGRQWLAPLPRYYDDETTLWVPYVLQALVMCLLPLLSGVKTQRRQWAMGAISAVVCVAAFVAVGVSRYDDNNFDVFLAMDRAIDEGRYSDAVDAFVASDSLPTRTNALLADAALLRMGQVGDRMFRMPMGSASYGATFRNNRFLHEAGAPLVTYNMGLCRYAYRWNMENMVEYGPSVERLQRLVKCSLVAGDYALAKKYLDILDDVPLQGAWVRKYRRYVDAPKLVASDKELGGVRALMPTVDTFTEENGMLEVNLWTYLSKQPVSNTVQLERSIVASMMCLDFDFMLYHLDKYMTTGRPLPTHFQEAVMMYSYASDDDVTDAYPLSPQVRERFNSFVSACQRAQQYDSDMMIESLRASFGDTFWFYCMYRSFMQFQ